MAERKKGTVVAVCSSPRHGFPTTPQERVHIGLQGIPGDAHSGPLRASFKNPGTEKPNDRPISIVADEVRREMNDMLGLQMKPGDFNEQILVSGLGDLANIPIGSVINFSTGVSLEVVDRAYPCETLLQYNVDRIFPPEMPERRTIRTKLLRALAWKRRDGTVHTRRGLLARVLTEGDLQSGDKVTITLRRNF